MAYVDLNPLRAGMTQTPEDSDFTSVQQRIEQHADTRQQRELPALKRLSPRQTDVDAQATVPFALRDYLNLVDWTGRCARADKRGAIAADTPPILQRLCIEPAQWQRTMLPAGLRFQQAVGSVARLQQYAENIGRRWVKGQAQARQLYAAGEPVSSPSAG